MTVLTKASQLLDIVSSSNESVSLKSLQKELDFPKSTIYRLANNMVDAGFLRKNENSHYSLGFRLLYWGRQTRDQNWLVRVSEAAMIALRDSINESVHLYVRYGLSRVCIAAKEGSHSLRVFGELGRELPLYVGAVGKVLLAFGPEEILDEALKICEVKNLTQKHRIIEELPDIKERRFATSIGEREPGAYALAVPIIGPDDTVSSAISISGPVVRYPEEKLESMRARLLQCANEIERFARAQDNK